jgi:hypothetical protein
MRIEGNDSRGLCDDKAAAPQADDEKHSSHAPILPPFVVLMAVSAVVWQSRSRHRLTTRYSKADLGSFASDRLNSVILAS